MIFTEKQICHSCKHEWIAEMNRDPETKSVEFVNEEIGFCPECKHAPESVHRCEICEENRNYWNGLQIF